MQNPLLGPRSLFAVALSLVFAEQWREREAARKAAIPVATAPPPLEADAALALFKERSPAVIAA